LKLDWIPSSDASGGPNRLGTYKSEKENVDEDILEMGVGPLAIELDIMQPLNPDKAPKVGRYYLGHREELQNSTICLSHHLIQVHVPPLNHIGIWVDNIEACVEHLTKEGFRFTPGGIRKGAAGYKVTFIHPKGNEATPKSGEGVLIELVQAPPEVIAEYDRVCSTVAIFDMRDDELTQIPCFLARQAIVL
jgi:lactoylglutathione lyase